MDAGQQATAKADLEQSSRWATIEMGKRKQNKFKHHGFSFTQYTSTLCRCIQNLKTFALIRAEKCVAKKFTGKKENCTNKGTVFLYFQ